MNIVLHDGGVKAGVVNAIVDSFSYRVKLQSNANITVGEDEVMVIITFFKTNNSSSCSFNYRTV